MKPVRMLLITILSSLILCAVVEAATVADIQAGKDKREAIIVELPADGSTNITYIAESTPGVGVNDSVWVCSKIIEVSSGGTNITRITVIPDLKAPGTNGVNLSTFDYPND